jgi:hypothetical protein
MARSLVVFDSQVGSNERIDFFLRCINNTGELDEGKFFPSVF